MKVSGPLPDRRVELLTFVDTFSYTHNALPTELIELCYLYGHSPFLMYLPVGSEGYSSRRGRAGGVESVGRWQRCTASRNKRKTWKVQELEMMVG